MPVNAHALAVDAVVNAWARRWEHAIGLAERALRCSPFDPTRHLALAATARARLFQGDAEAALVVARSLVRLGRMQELAIAVERMRASFPGVCTAYFSAHATFEPFSAELTAAGLPDCPSMTSTMVCPIARFAMCAALPCLLPQPAVWPTNMS
jgi:hypothetical protein